MLRFKREWGKEIYSLKEMVETAFHAGSHGSGQIEDLAERCENLERVCFFLLSTLVNSGAIPAPQLLKSSLFSDFKEVVDE